jgi:hypothetical protein
MTFRAFSELVWTEFALEIRKNKGFSAYFSPEPFLICSSGLPTEKQKKQPSGAIESGNSIR